MIKFKSDEHLFSIIFFVNTYTCGIHINVVSYSKGNILVNVKMYFIETDDKITSFSFLHAYLADEKHRRK